MTNMRQFMFNHIVNAEVVILNRADNVDRRYLRNNIKSINQMVEIIYEDKDGNVTNKIDDDMYDELTDLDKEEEEYITGKNVINLDSPGYPFDSRVEDNGEVYYYPCSMAGFYWRTEKSPEAYNNVVQIMVPQGGDLRLGLRKTAAIGGDWLIYRNFELYYLGKDTPSSVNKVNVKRTSDNGMFNFAGQRVDASYKGFAIKNGKKFTIFGRKS